MKNFESLDKVNFLFLLLLVVPYFFNDIIYFFIDHSYIALTVTEYLLRVTSIGFLLGYLGRQKISKVLQSCKGNCWLWAIAFTIIGVLSDFVFYAPLDRILDYKAFFKFPPYPSYFLKFVDLTFGLVLVAVSEELIFRFYIIEWLKKIPLGKIGVIVISSLIFGVIHWGHGGASIILAFVWGILPAYYYVSRKNIMPCLIGHYLTNLFVFINY